MTKIICKRIDPEQQFAKEVKQNNYPQKKKEFAKEPIQINNLQAKSRDQEQKFAKEVRATTCKSCDRTTICKRSDAKQQFAKEVIRNKILQKK